MAEILLGSHVGMSGKEMFLGSVKEAAEYGATLLSVVCVAALVDAWTPRPALPLPVADPHPVSIAAVKTSAVTIPAILFFLIILISSSVL